VIPIRDENPSGTVPVVTMALIGINCLVFLFEMALTNRAVHGFIYTFGLVPASAWSLAGAELGPAAEAVVARSGPPILTVFTSMFLHGGVMHILGNMWFLWLFGDNIEDRVGHVGFILFYLLCGVGASATHVFFAGASPIPMVGASGAIAGVLGAYFVCFPRARVLTIVPVFFLLFIRLPAYFFLLMWLVGQISGVLSPDEMGIAWWAHIGGFALGAFLALFWPKCASARQAAYQAKPDAWRSRRRGTLD
jgi:membrane associated rhomboid family serine protease